MKLTVLLTVSLAVGAHAGTDCSGNGFYYDDIQGCQCFNCFEGPQCQNEKKDCSINDSGGNPNLFEEYWRNHTGAGSETVQEVYYRSPYQFGSVMTDASRASMQGTLLPLLNDTIISLHQRVGNIADLGAKSLVIGAGGTQLIAAAIYACKALHAPNSQLYVFAQPPYYSGYTGGLVAIGMTNVSFTTSLDHDPSQVIEFIAYPNNPTNSFNKPRYPNAVCIVHDQVYWWPSLTNLQAGGAPLNTQISLFSMSKLTGHAGTRLGWALVDNAQFATAMGNYVSAMSIHVSIDAQYRSYQVLQYLQHGDNLQFFGWVKSVMTSRWEEINSILANQTKLTQYATPGGFYAWIQCNDLSPGQTCQDLFMRHGITPSSGPSFGGTNDYIRLELVVSTATWQLLKQRVASIVA
eukprot:TRINITY_DN16197_c0_g3_i1.p1 TRINITY_DN16197_c0_g3~~TRINITY_DN16197_c0_g3_i1.p1  ORF type:complete len:407 (+),score=124.56 TRINITY_DN16197_c0_g3_i1:46-1266(+)